MSCGNWLRVVLMGNPRSGKTLFIDRMLGRPSPKIYIPTLGSERSLIRYQNSLFEIFDVGGNPIFNQLKSVPQGEIGVIVGDHNAQFWIDRFRVRSPRAEIVQIESIDALCLTSLASKSPKPIESYVI